MPAPVTRSNSRQSTGGDTASSSITRRTRSRVTDVQEPSHDQQSMKKNPAITTLDVPQKSGSFGRSFLRCCVYTGVTLFLLLFVVVPWLLASAILSPPLFRREEGFRPLTTPYEIEWHGRYVQDPLADHQLPFEPVEFLSDGEIIHGWYVPGANESATVICVHGAGQDRREFLRHLPIFNELGLSVLMFDCREHGVNRRVHGGISYGVREHRDVLAAASYIMETKPNTKSLVAFGSSQGGTSVLLAAAQTENITHVIVENPFTNAQECLDFAVRRTLTHRPRWGSPTGGVDKVLLDITNAVKGFIPSWYIDYCIRVTLFRLGFDPDTHDALDAVVDIYPRPILFMHGSNDTMIPLSHSQRLYESARGPKHLWIAEDATHAQILNQQRDEWIARVSAFINKHVFGRT